MVDQVRHVAEGEAPEQHNSKDDVEHDAHARGHMPISTLESNVTVQVQMIWLQVARLPNKQLEDHGPHSTANMQQLHPVCRTCIQYTVQDTQGTCVFEPYSLSLKDSIFGAKSNKARSKIVHKLQDCCTTPATAVACCFTQGQGCHVMARHSGKGRAMGQSTCRAMAAAAVAGAVVVAPAAAAAVSAAAVRSHWTAPAPAPASVPAAAAAPALLLDRASWGNVGTLRCLWVLQR